MQYILPRMSIDLRTGGEKERKGVFSSFTCLHSRGGMADILKENSSLSCSPFSTIAFSIYPIETNSPFGANYEVGAPVGLGSISSARDQKRREARRVWRQYKSTGGSSHRAAAAACEQISFFALFDWGKTVLRFRQAYVPGWVNAFCRFGFSLFFFSEWLMKWLLMGSSTGDMVSPNWCWNIACFKFDRRSVLATFSSLWILRFLETRLFLLFWHFLQMLLTGLYPSRFSI